jgi:drug/metabolite transporter (DMT)-like permease
VASLLAILSAAFFGAADFIGGLASRRAHSYAVVVATGIAGLALLAVLIPLLPAATPSARDLAWGAASGLAGGVAIALLYRALAIGTMSVVAPVTAVCGVVLPVVAGLIVGERPSTLTGIGMLLALVAIVLVGQESEQAAGAGARASGPAIRLALFAGIAIGLFYLALAETSPEAGLWPLVAARAVSVSLFGVALIVGRHTLRMPAPLATLVIAGGVLDMVANALYLLATRGGPLGVVVVLSSLYPASTVLLARIILKERLSQLQLLGVVSAIVAVALIVGGS